MASPNDPRRTLALQSRRARVFTSEAPARVLVVDDEALIRSVLIMALSRDPRLVVVGEAANAAEAEARIEQLNPDVLTLDIEMPGQSGLDFLSRLAEVRPLPVVLLSGRNRKGSVAAVQGLARGAIDFVAKPRNGVDDAFVGDLCARVVSAASARRYHPPTEPVRKQAGGGSWNGRVVMIGASTGGVQAIEQILGGLDDRCPPIVIAQHMPSTFLASFAERLNHMLNMRVCLARGGELLEPGLVLIAPGGPTGCQVAMSGGDWTLSLVPRAQDSGATPSIDRLFASAAQGAPRVVSVLLTGLGSDGVEGMRRIKAGGGHCIAQDAASCVVYGMPRVAVERGAITQQVCLNDIAAALGHLCFSRLRGVAP